MGVLCLSRVGVAEEAIRVTLWWALDQHWGACPPFSEVSLRQVLTRRQTWLTLGTRGLKLAAMRGRDNGPGGRRKSWVGEPEANPGEKQPRPGLGWAEGLFQRLFKNYFLIKIKKKKSAKGRSHLDKIPLCSMKFLEARPIQDAITIIQPKDICLHVLLASQPPWQHPGLSGK